nr:hypothetical protein [Tanacetum cinerariifolium]
MGLLLNADPNAPLGEGGGVVMMLFLVVYDDDGGVEMVEVVMRWWLSRVMAWWCTARCQQWVSRRWLEFGQKMGGEVMTMAVFELSFIRSQASVRDSFSCWEKDWISLRSRLKRSRGKNRLMKAVRSSSHVLIVPSLSLYSHVFAFLVSDRGNIIRIGFGSTIELISFDESQVVTFDGKFICGFRNGNYEPGSRSDNTVDSPRGFIIHGIEIFKGNEKVTEETLLFRRRSIRFRVRSGSGNGSTSSEFKDLMEVNFIMKELGIKSGLSIVVIDYVRRDSDNMSSLKVLVDGEAKKVSYLLCSELIATTSGRVKWQSQSPEIQQTGGFMVPLKNYLQQLMPNPEDIIDSTIAMNMTLALMAKAFKLNYSTPTNNNQRISSNPRNRQIAQPGMNMGQDRQMQMIGGCLEPKSSECWKSESDWEWQSCHKEYDLMVAAADLDEIEEVNANCILMANLQQASSSVTSNSVSTPPVSKDVNNDKVIAPGMFRISPDKVFREAKKSSRSMNKEVKVEEHHRNLLLSKKNKNNSSACNNSKIDSLNTRKSRLLLRWSPTGRLFDHDGKLVTSSKSESQVDCSNGDNACTSNAMEPTIKWFPNSTSLLGRLSRFVYGASTQVVPST